MSHDKRPFSQIAKHARRRLGLTQEGFARLVGVTLRTITRWENGESVPRQGAQDRVRRLLR